MKTPVMEIDLLNKVLSTEKLLLEPISHKHAALLFQDLQTTDLYTYIPAEAPVSIDALKAKYTRWEARSSPDKTEVWLNYAVSHKVSGEYMGTFQATIEKEGNAYIAYEVFPDYQRRGIASEGVSQLITFIFENFSQRTITAHVDIRNTPSTKLLETLGFKKISLIRNADFFKGRASDEYIYQLQVDEWNGA